MSKDTIPSTTSEDTNGHMEQWSYVEERDLSMYVSDMSVSSSTEHISYTLRDGREIHVPQAALVSCENVQRYRASAGMGNVLDRNEVQRLATDLRKTEKLARHLNMKIATDFLSDVIRSVDDAAGLIEFVLAPSASDLLLDEQVQLQWPLPKEVVR